MTCDCSMSLGSDNQLKISGVFNSTEAAYVNDAVVSVTLLHEDDTEVSGQSWPTALVYIADSSGDYSCILHDTLDVEDEERVTAVITIVADGINTVLQLSLLFKQETVADLNWSSKEELERMFGVSNVQQWADLENNEVVAEINSQVQWAVQQATEDAKLRLKTSPFDVAGLTCVPSPLRVATTRLAGVMLYESRGIKDIDEDGQGRHRLVRHERLADKFFRQVIAGQLVLDAGTVMHPTVSESGDADVDYTSLLPGEETFFG